MPAMPLQEASLPCLISPDLYFSDKQAELAEARILCGSCPVKDLCLAGASERQEPHGVWGGQIFLAGVVVDRKPPRGRPRKDAA